MEKKRKNMLFTLILKPGPDTLHHRIPHLRTLMHQMKVFTSRLTHNPRISLVSLQITRDIPPQTFEYDCAACEMQRGEQAVVDGLGDNGRCGTGYELDDARGNASFGEDLMNEVVGVGCCWGRFPEDDIAD